MDINKLIMESIQNVIEEEEKPTVGDVVGGVTKTFKKAGKGWTDFWEKKGAQVHDAKEAVKKEIEQNIETAKAERMPQHEPPDESLSAPQYEPGEYESKVGVIDKLKRIGEQPVSTKAAAAVAAAIAAGLGAKKIVEEMRKRKKVSPRKA